MRIRLLRNLYFILSLTSFALAQDYTITNLGWLLGLPNATPVGVNRIGQVAGVSSRWCAACQQNPDHVFIWTKGIGLQNLGPGDAFAINDNSYIAGSISGSAVIWKADGSVQDLGISNSYAYGINNSGDVVGLYDPGNGSEGIHAFLWSPTTGMQDLGTLGGSQTVAKGVNYAQQVVGYSFTTDGSRHAFLWTEGGGLQDLGTLGSSFSQAIAINNNGQITGDSAIPSDPKVHVFLWTQSGGMQDLGQGVANSINNRGQIAGSQFTSESWPDHAMLWTQGVVEDLNDLMANSGWSLASAVGINDAGQIATWAYRPDERNMQIHALLLSPRMSPTVVSSQNPSSFGEIVHFTATVTNRIQGPPPDGDTVVFKVGKTVLATVPLKNGVARYRTSSLTVGSHVITATYLGDINYAATQSKGLEQVVSK